MQRIQLSQDIRPLSEFRANVTSFIEQVHKTNRPLIITQHGKSTAVLLNVTEYEAMLEKLELIEDIRTSEQEIASDKTVSHSQAKKQALAKFKK